MSVLFTPSRLKFILTPSQKIAHPRLKIIQGVGQKLATIIKVIIINIIIVIMRTNLIQEKVMQAMT